MGMSAVKPYFRSKLSALGFKEWDYPFDAESIPETVSNKCFHVLLGRGNGTQTEARFQAIQHPVIITIIRDSGNNAPAAYDKMVSDADAIVSACCATADRLNGTVTNVVFNGMEISKLNANNDKKVLMKMDFTVLVLLNL